MTVRIAVVGVDAPTTTAVSSRLATRANLPLISSPVSLPAHAGRLTPDEFTNVRDALRDFETRTDDEANPRSFISDGSVLQHWAVLAARYRQRRRDLVSRPKDLADMVFLRGFVRAHEGIVARHARVSYSSMIVVAPSINHTAIAHDLLVTAASTTGLPVRVLQEPDQLNTLISALGIAESPNTESVTL